MVVEETRTRTPGVATDACVPGRRTAPPTGSPLEHALRYTRERAWDVFPGTWLETVGGVPRCTCADPACPAPGAHPARLRWRDEATGSATTARHLWTTAPRAAVLLPTGRAFDALEVSEAAGCLALARLERMAAPLGPVISSPGGRMAFFVLPGSTTTVPHALRRLGWSPAWLDLRTRGDGDWVAAPPTRLGERGPVQWAREPNAANRWLPGAEELVPTLAYACAREAVDRPRAVDGTLAIDRPRAIDGS
ncbi:bifunctional DNA primase/polymerase [Streptomyces reniochalinae]|uniref:DNA primase n=1 Tax=Streptomyces reniochalinae TaxID=2250578 RepID=A0A367EIR0_9ACTN|nr:bifunctional DNA primase/polymerase [Streptomyces reniochalinae]RCG17986.1 DNA primase [Streptomyces reniochalinae]